MAEAWSGFGTEQRRSDEEPGPGVRTLRVPALAPPLASCVA